MGIDTQKFSELAGKSAIVTGASRGIGAAVAVELAAQGVQVVLAARSHDHTQNLAAEITERGGQAIAVPCDVSRYADLVNAVKTCTERFGGIDILVNNAGVIEPIARLADSDPNTWWQAAQVNYQGVYHGLRAVIPLMERQGSGVIVNISSGAATSALEGWSHYCSAKAAVLSLTRCVHREYGEKGIRVVGLSPGTVATDMQRSIKASGVNPVSEMDWDRHIPPSWPARAVAYLCISAASDLAGDDFSLKSDEARARVGLTYSVSP